MIEDSGNTQHVALLAALNGCPDLAPYNLTLYYESDEREQDALPAWCAIVQDPLSHDVCHQILHGSLDRFLEQSTPSVLRYCDGKLCFVVPFTRSDISYLLTGEGDFGDGPRESGDFWQQSPLSQTAGVEVFPVFPDAEAFPSKPMQRIARAARQVMRVLPSLPPEIALMPAPAEVVPRLARTVASLSLIDEVKTVAETIAISGALLGSLFDYPKLAIAWRSEEGKAFTIAQEYGDTEKVEVVPEEAVSELIRPRRVKRSVRFDEKMQRVFVGLEAATAAIFPIDSKRVPLGFIALFDCALQGGDLLLMELITTRVAAKLILLKKEQEHAKLSELSDHLMSLANTLLLSESKEDLYRAILEIAADLLKASQGSVMLIDRDGEQMHVVHTKGMHGEIAKYLRVQVGVGIAGKVAQSGTALLVKDVEKDLQVGLRNRPRFKSKSLISIPLKLNDKVLGVLNLSDKANLGLFSETDLNLLTSFATLASLMIERTVVMEEACRFEQLSLTDPLTGIYNRRFLNTRLEEEMHRSLRQGLELSVLFIDLDHFKCYNDRFGHLAGDVALKKTAEIIKATLRDMDIVARYGGEEFCVLLPGTSKSLAQLVAERIREGIARERFPVAKGGADGRLTASLGVASFPEDGGTLACLLHASDMALYQAKASGRNRLVAAQAAPAANRMPPSPLAAAENDPAVSPALPKVLRISAPY